MPTGLELEVSLRWLRPRIWRRFVLRDDLTFRDLHDAIQDGFGWTDSHLWEFSKPGRGGATIAVADGLDPDDGWTTDDADTPEASEVTLASYFRSRGPKKRVYTYDFGDHWVHEVALRRRVELPDASRRRLLAGARACPPEDCGGEPGYGACVAFVLTGKHPWQDADEFADWLGDWRPEAFDLDAARREFDVGPDEKRRG